MIVFVLACVSVPISIGFVLWVLSTDKLFLKTALGKYIFVTRDFYNVNQTAMAFDSTGPEQNQAQVSEVFAKSVIGRVLPNLDESKNANDFILNHVFEDKLPKFMNEVPEPFCTYYEFLKQHFDIAKVKSLASQFVLETSTCASFSNLPSVVQNYQLEMESKSFTTPFSNMFLSRNSHMSFHTFGRDMHLLKNAIESSKKRWRHFISTTYRTTTFYTEVVKSTENDDKYSQTFSAKQLQDELLLCSDHVFLIQENYERWAKSGKLNKFGKRAEIFWHPLKIIRGVIFDNVDCWNNASKQSISFIHVNSVLAALTPNYFLHAIEEKEPAIWQSAGFWSLLTIFSVLNWLIVTTLGWKLCLIAPFVLLYNDFFNPALFVCTLMPVLFFGCA